MAQPNILVICTDQQRYNSLGLTSGGVYHTPNIDYLAEQGVLFENCYAQCTVCAPARASLVTGKFPHSHGLWANGVEMPLSESVFTRALANGGYRCGWIGKQHLGPAWGGRSEAKRDDGISDLFWSHDPRHPSSGNAFHQWLQREHPSLFDAAMKGELLDGQDDPELSSFDCLPIEASYSRWVSATACEVLSKYRQNKEPWFLWINFFAPHHPFFSFDDFLALYPLEEISCPVVTKSELEKQPGPLHRMRASANAGGARSYDDYDANGIREVIRAYRAMVSHVDFEIGKILEATNGLDRSTVTVFLSDHGEMLGDHGLLLKGPAMYEEAVKVPLIVSWPEHLPAKTSTEALVQQIDLAATLLDAADLLDEGPNFGQGTSLMPLARGERTQVRHWAITEYRNSGRPEVPPLNGTMYREDDKKLIVYHSLSTGGVRREYQLFDLAEDPNEVDDGSAKEPDEVAAEMMGTMLDRLVEVERREAPRLALW